MTKTQKTKLLKLLNNLPTCTHNYSGPKDHKGRVSISKALLGSHNSHTTSLSTLYKFLSRNNLPSSVKGKDVAWSAYYSFTTTHSPVQNTKRMVRTLTKLLELQ